MPNLNFSTNWITKYYNQCRMLSTDFTQPGQGLPFLKSITCPAQLHEFWNSSICLYEIKKKNLFKSTCPTGSFTCPGLSGSGKWRALRGEFGYERNKISHQRGLVCLNILLYTSPASQNSKTAHKCNVKRKPPSGSIMIGSKPLFTWGHHRRKTNAIGPIIIYVKFMI